MMRRRNEKLWSGRSVIGKLLLDIVCLFLVSLIIVAHLARTLMARPIQDNTTLELGWIQCASTLYRAANPGGDIDLHQYLRPIVSHESEFVKLTFAVMYIESHFRPGLISSRDAYGEMQVTEEASRDCRMPLIMGKESLLDRSTSIRYGSCYLYQAWEETGHNIDRTLIIYNAGRKWLTSYDHESKLPNETAQYIVSVHHALNICTNGRN